MMQLNQINKQTLHSAFLLILLALFAVISFCVITIGSRQYHSITNRMIQNDKLRTASSYLTETFHQYDTIGGISITELEGIPAISFSNENDQTLLIYAYDGYLRELPVHNSNNLHLPSGKKICEIAQFIINECSNTLYCFTLKDPYGTTTQIYLSLNATRTQKGQTL